MNLFRCIQEMIAPEHDEAPFSIEQEVARIVSSSPPEYLPGKLYHIKAGPPFPSPSLPSSSSSSSSSSSPSSLLSSSLLPPSLPRAEEARKRLRSERHEYLIDLQEGYFKVGFFNPA